MKKKKKIHEGRTKKLYTVDEAEQLIQEFKDDTIDSKEEATTTIKGKGAINNQISAFIFDYLNGYHVPTHYINTVSNREMLVKKLDIIPIKIVVHNIATGNLCVNYGVEDGKLLDFPILEYYLKDKSRNNPMMNATHVIAFRLAQKDELRSVDRLATKINAVLKSFFGRRRLKLVNFQLEFGRYKSKILVGDEISADTCRFWDITADDQLDRDRFSFASNNLENVFKDIQERLF